MQVLVWVTLVGSSQQRWALSLTLTLSALPIESEDQRWKHS